MLNQIVPALAQHGNVIIVGRSGFANLKGYVAVLNVCTQAPLAARIQHMMAEQGLTAEQTEASIVGGDKGRAAFVESFYKVRWNDATAFDLVLNTDKVATDLAIAWMIQAAQAASQRVADHSPICASIEVEPILAKTVAAALSNQTPQR